MDATTLLERSQVTDALPAGMLAAVAKLTSDVVILVDYVGAIQYINHTVQGLHVEEVVGKNILDYVPREFHARYRQAFDRAFDERLPDQFEVTFIGDTRWKVRTAPLVGHEGADDWMLVVGIDQTALYAVHQNTFAEQTARLREAQAIAKVGSFHWTVSNDTLHWSDELYRIFGVSPGRFTADYQAYTERVHPDDRAEVQRRVSNCVSAHEPFEHEYRIVLDNGLVRWVVSRCRPVFDDRGNVLAIEGTCQDINDRVIAERAVRESETRFAQFAEAIPQIIWMASADNHRHYFVNSAYEQIMGLSARELLGNPLDWLDIVHPADRERIRHRLTEPRDAIHVEEFRIIRPDGQERWLQNRVIPILNDSGQVYMHVGLSEDITERKRAEETLARKQIELAKANRFNILGETVAGVSHEITQPLTAIANFAGACAALLERDQFDLPELRGYVDEIRAQSTRAGKIVHSLRALVRRAEPRREPSNLNQIVRETMAFLHADLRQAQVEARLELARECPTILMDRVQLQQVIVNLVRNACEALQATPDQERAIVVRTRSFDTWLELECEDNGPGFVADHATRLFQAFFTTKPDGMGMGLAICRTIVETHNGRISAANVNQGGASIRITLPVAES